jgi:hypothetical protein
MADETPSWLSEEPKKESKSPEPKLDKLFKVNLVAREASTVANVSGD